MKIGVAAFFDGYKGRTMADLRAVAAHVEACGYHSFWLPEHVVFFERYESKYPYSADGNPGFRPRQGAYDPLFGLAVAAGATSTLRLGTTILIVPERNPLVLAQEVVALDHASDGRFDFGIGIGWSAEEFAALGIPWPRRGARTDDYLQAMKVLWVDEVCTYEGEFTSFQGVIAEPKPVQSPHPPIWVGGHPGPSMRRTARYCDGWYGWALPAEALPATMAELDQICEQEGRDPASVRRMVGLPFGGGPDELAPYLEAAEQAGAEQVVLTMQKRGVDIRQRLDELARFAGG